MRLPCWLLLAVLACVACDGDHAPDQRGATQLTSANGSFTATFRPDPDPPVTGTNALDIELGDDHGEPVAGAALSVEPWMPAHGHGSSHAPVVEELGGGKYRASQIELSMPGAWELRIGVSAGESADSFLLEVEVR